MEFSHQRALHDNHTMCLLPTKFAFTLLSRVKKLGFGLREFQGFPASAQQGMRE